MLYFEPRRKVQDAVVTSVTNTVEQVKAAPKNTADAVVGGVREKLSSVQAEAESQKASRAVFMTRAGWSICIIRWIFYFLFDVDHLLKQTFSHRSLDIFI